MTDIELERQRIAAAVRTARELADAYVLGVIDSSVGSWSDRYAPYLAIAPNEWPRCVRWTGARDLIRMVSALVELDPWSDVAKRARVLLEITRERYLGLEETAAYTCIWDPQPTIDIYPSEMRIWLEVARRLLVVTEPRQCGTVKADATCAPSTVRAKTCKETP